MPFKSEAQRRWMFSQKPEMAKEWQAHTPKGAHLPAHLAKGGKIVNHGDHFKVHTAGGDVYTIAHKGLHPSTVKHLQKFAEGGTAGEDETAEPDAETAGAYENEDTIQAGMPAVTAAMKRSEAEDELDRDPNGRPQVLAPDMPGQEAGNVNLTPEGGSPGIGGSAFNKADTSAKLPPGAPEEQQPEQPGSTSDTIQLQKHVAPTVHGISQKERDLAAEGNAARTENAQRQEQLAGETEKVNNEKIQNLQAMQAKSDEFYTNMHARQAKLREDIENGKIDPSHLWHDVGTGGRIAAGIGILLAGVGSGLSGGPNVALQMLDKAIDRDIDAQKTNLHTKQSLLADTYRETGDFRLAQAEAKNTLTTIALAKLNTIAAQSSSAQVKANAKLVNAAVLLKQEQDMRGIADRRSLYWANAKNADVTQANALALQKAKAGDQLKTPREMQGAKIGNFNSTITELKDHLASLQEGSQGLWGAIKQGTPAWLALGNAEKRGHARAEILREKIASALGGGVASDARIKKALESVADAGDNEQLAKDKTQDLIDILETTRDAYARQQGGVGYRVGTTEAEPSKKKPEIK